MTLRLLALLVLTGVAAVACGSSSAPSLSAVGAGLRGPSGVRATVYARGIPQMSAFAFDAGGRLWVTRSGASAHAADGVYVVPRAGAAPVRVVSSIRGPLGLVWAGGDLYVSSLDGVDRFSGLAGRRFAHRTRILAGPVAGAENNNLVLAPNGRLVMGVSAACDHCATSPHWSAAIVSFARDGSHLRVVASGVRAAYGLTYSGGTLYASMNQRDDLGKKTPGDWVAGVENGQDWGFPRCYGQGGPACAGVPSPLAVLDPHAAAGGVAVVGRSILVTEWAYGKVMRASVHGGATAPFLTGLVRPLPLAVARGGALFVGDWATGVIYRVTGSTGA